MYSSDEEEVDPELLRLFQERLATGAEFPADPPDDVRTTFATHVLSSAEYIVNQAVDVALDPRATKDAAQLIAERMRTTGYSTKTWSSHELHPCIRDDDGDDRKREIVDFIFTMDLLNFCFWPDRSGEENRFTVLYKDKKWTGYWSLVAALQRALDKGIPITTPSFWIDQEACPDDTIKEVFRSCTSEDMPMIEQRISCLRHAGNVLCTEFNGRFTHCIDQAQNSAAALINILITKFSSTFRDVFPSPFDDDSDDEYVPVDDADGRPRRRKNKGRRREVFFLKRAQILVADLWACFDRKGYGSFDDVDRITTFADYRIPQMLHTMGCLKYSPPLEAHVRALKEMESGGSWEVQIRGCTIWAVELLRRQISRLLETDSRSNGVAPFDLPEKTAGPQSSDETTQTEERVMATDASALRINAILIDFFLYDTCKEQERLATTAGEEADANGELLPSHGKKQADLDSGERSMLTMIPHHRVRSIWY